MADTDESLEISIDGNAISIALKALDRLAARCRRAAKRLPLLDDKVQAQRLVKLAETTRSELRRSIFDFEEKEARGLRRVDECCSECGQETKTIDEET